MNDGNFRNLKFFDFRKNLKSGGSCQMAEQRKKIRLVNYPQQNTEELQRMRELFSSDQVEIEWTTGKNNISIS